MSPAPPPQHFWHELLGEVEILDEDGVGADRRLIVRDSGGTEHTLLAAHAHLKPVSQKVKQSPLPPPAPPASDEDDDMPF